jgi:hypothetical protein
LARPDLGDPGEVVGEHAYLVQGGDRSVAGDHDRRPQRDDPLERALPVRQRPDPHDRTDADEEHVGRDHDVVGREVRDHVAVAVRRADLDQVDAAPADVERALAGKGLGRPGEAHPAEVEAVSHRGEVPDEQLGLGERGQPAGQPHDGEAASLARQAYEAPEALRVLVVEVRLAGVGRDDPIGADDRIAPCVVAVGMGVEQRADRRAAQRRRREHALGRGFVPLGIDQQRLAAATDDQRGVALAPAAGWVHPSVHARSDLVPAQCLPRHSEQTVRSR